MDNVNEYRKVQQGEIEIHVGSMDVFNCAMYQNGISPIRGIQILNKTADPIEGLSMAIIPETDLIGNQCIELPPILPGKPTRIEDPDLPINGKALAELTEPVTVNVKIAVLQDDEIITGIQGEIKILTYDQWMGVNYEDLLPAFVMPNHPVVIGLIHDAATVLKKWGDDPSLEGYQSKDLNRVIKLAAAAFASIQKKNIVYAEPPVNIWERGQRIRTPEIMMEQRLGTCMDFTILYASCLEAMGLHTILYAIEGHIFIGIWLHETNFNDVRLISNEEILKRCIKGSEEIIFIECTEMRSGGAKSFEVAEVVPGASYKLAPDVFRFAIDVYYARQKRIRPLFSRTMKDGKYEIEVAERGENEITAAPAARKIEIQTDLNTGKRKITNKKELWETKLLDLTTNNMLLNLPYRSVEPILSSYVDELEDALADGEEFRLLPLPVDMVKNTVTIKEKEGKGKEKEKEVPLIAYMLGKNHGPYEMTDWQIGGIDFTDRWRQEARSHRLYTYRSPDELDKNLTAIYRAASSSQQENGVSSLYLAVGLLRWIDEETREVHHAPLILVPIEIVRKSANQGYALHMRDEEPHFNLTLLEMLKQNHNIDIGGLDPLPADDHGVDIKRVFAIVRSHLQTVRNWDVVETCVVGNFSFAQFAMWNDLHRAGDMLDNSNIVRSLIKGHVDWDVSKKETEEQGVYLPITVDGTQLEAIRMAANGQTFVLHGPPGTGKSQTITGMIANLMAHGKKVLFVAEKMAALSVVEKRLTSLGIGDFCLELHSDKANKKHVLTQLDKALSNQGKKKKDEYEEYLRKFNTSRDELDRYMKHLHEPRNCGYSMHELIDLYETTAEQEKKIPFTRDEVREMTKDQIRSHRELLGRLTAAGDNVGDPLQHPLKSVGLDTYSFAIRSKVEETVSAYLKMVGELRGKAEETAEICGLKKPEYVRDYEHILRFAECAKKINSADLSVIWLVDGNAQKVKDYIAAGEKLEAEKQKLLKDWKEEALKADMMSVIQRYEAAVKKLLGKGSALKALTAELQQMSRAVVNTDKIPDVAREIMAWQEKNNELENQRERLSAQEKDLLKYVRNAKGLEEAKAEAEELRKGIAASGTDLSVLKAVSVSEAAVNSYRTTFESFVAAQKALNDLLVRDTAGADEEETAVYLQKTPSALKDWTIYVSSRNDCLRAGLEPAVRSYEGGMPSAEVYPAYRKGLYYALINEIISTDEVLSTFSGSSFNESVRQFKQVDDVLLQHTRTEIFNKLVDGIPSNLDSAESGMELNLLRKAIGSNARGMSIRNLFEKLSHIIQSLCPVMLMSPNSVAQYLERKNDLFDIVIFDEASQLPTCKAVGALARAKAAVIVGDPKQMPPTSFFAGGSQITDDLSLADLDSILDDALALGIPSQYLQWHYRSTHESLIAFSNFEFYDNKMFTFPSANDRERHVTAVHVDGVYKKSVNAREAEAVVEEIIRRYRDPVLKKLSIGVVTFNIKQQDVIYNLLNKQFQKDPDLDAWANSGEDPLFIKNLENVQGDERDVILFSIGYGPDEHGHVSMNFGPINKAGGGKRLNVAFSRARVSMMIFSSLYSSQIKVTDSSPDGLKAFQAFLHYAEGNSLGAVQRSLSSEEEVKDGIMLRICKALTDQGYECQTNIGQSSFHVDIAVADPYDSTQYLMGILLDGENYRMTRNTRDREVAQISVLKRLGWSLYRVWTIDWWDNADKQLRLILDKLETAKADAEKRFAEKQKNLHEETETEKAALEQELAAQVAEVIEEEEQATPDLFSQTLTQAERKIEEEDKPVETEAAEEREEPAETEEPAVSTETAETEETDEPAEQAEPAETAEPDEAEAPETLEEKEAKDNPADVPAEVVDPQFTGDYRRVEYVTAQLLVTPLVPEDYIAPTNRKEMVRRLEMILEAEAPIHRDALAVKLMASFDIKRASVKVVEANEKALKAAKIKNVKLKGVVFCWKKDADPNAYRVFRVAERNADEICIQELKNAICYTIKENGGKMDRDELMVAVARNLGYKRMGKNVESALQAAMQYAKTQGVIDGSGQVFLKG